VLQQGRSNVDDLKFGCIEMVHSVGLEYASRTREQKERRRPDRRRSRGTVNCGEEE
jgi:hypothetical protein